MALRIRDYTIARVAQTTHHESDVTYGASRRVKCSYISLISATWALLKSSGLWYKFDLAYISGKRDQLFKFIGKFRYLGIKDLPQELLIEKFSINVEFFEIKTGEITAGKYLLSVTEIVNSLKEIRNSDLLVVNNYILGLIWGFDSMYLFDSQKNMRREIYQVQVQQIF